ncbi:MAG: pyrimidine dimer DNA glycosylase, partial [Cellulomonas sp.]|nr:pyrimidine dimer DNA glycosylase [Cellulomonas sp.]
ESLLAQAVLVGATKGYQHHPQLDRFREQPDPMAAIGAYLAGLRDEATARGYRFDAGRILRQGEPVRLTVTDGQLALEWRHLGAKLAARSPKDAERWSTAAPAPHPLFVVIPGPVASWERAGEG